MKKLFLVACSIAAFALAGCTDSPEDGGADKAIELSRPVPSVSIERDIATLTWTAVPKCEGYHYELDGVSGTAASNVNRLVTEQLANGPHTFTLYALGNGETTLDSKQSQLDFVIDWVEPEEDITQGVFIKTAGGQFYRAEATTDSADVYEVTIACSAQQKFTIMIDNVEYGWISYSGNGGVGTVNDIHATVPYYLYDEYGGGHFLYYVRESVGRLTSDEGFNNLYTNLDADAEVKFIIDRSYDDGTPRYRMTLVEPENPNILLEQHFDLFVWGGDWSGPRGVGGNNNIVGSALTSGDKYAAADASTIDGTEIAVPRICSMTSGGTTEGSFEFRSERYDQNRNLQGWEGNTIIEHPGYIRINTNSTYIYTPRLTALSAPTTVFVEFDMIRFAGAGPNIFAVDGDGVITACEYNKDGGSAATATVSGNEQRFEITPDMSNPFSAEADGRYEPKKWTHLKFTIEGATANTRVGIVETKTSAGRMCLDNVVITKE